MAKVAIKSKKLTPFGGIFSIMEQLNSMFSPVIDSVLGMRCKLYGYQYSEIIRSLMSVYFCGGSCKEDVTSHLMYHLSLHPTLRTCSADTILRAIKELTQDNIWLEQASKILHGRKHGVSSATALIRNFYKFIMERLDAKKFGLKATSRIKAFVFKFISRLL